MSLQLASERKEINGERGEWNLFDPRIFLIQTLNDMHEKVKD